MLIRIRIFFMLNPIIKLGISGEKGSFSEQAAILYSKQHTLQIELNYLTDMEGVLSAIEDNSVQLGIFPVVNLNGGLVKMAYEAMGKYPFKLIDELWMEIHLCLLVNPGVRKDQIQGIVSHSQPFKQSRDYLQKNFHHIPHREWEDTAKAAKELKEGRLPYHYAVIAPKQSAKIYELEILEENIEDHQPNLTAFILVSRFSEMTSQTDNFFLATPKRKEQETCSLEKIRKKINDIDKSLIEKLAIREKMAVEIGKLKVESGKEIFDTGREAELINFHEKLSVDYNLSPNYIKRLFRIIMNHSKNRQKNKYTHSS